MGKSTKLYLKKKNFIKPIYQNFFQPLNTFFLTSTFGIAFKNPELFLKVLCKSEVYV